MNKTGWVLLIVLGSGVATADTIPADAAALFDQGIADMQAGKLDVACKELAASLAKYSDSGTRGALATCYTKAGKIASAWVLWKELADTETDAARRASASQHATELGPRLPKYQVKLTGAPPPGLVVTINGQTVADPTLSTALPVDPGPLQVVAKAPGHGDFNATLQATEGKTTEVDIPELKPATTGDVNPPPHQPPPPPASGTHSSRKLYAAIAGGVGLVGIGVGAAFGISANGSFNDAKRICGGDVGNCPIAMVNPAQKNVNDARDAARNSTIAFGVAGAAIAAAAILYLTAPKESETGVAIAPVIAPSSAGVVLSGRW